MELNPSESKSLVPGDAVALPGVSEEAPPAADNRPPLLRAWTKLSRTRQIGLLAIVALCLALAVAMLMWSQSTEYGTLYGELPEKDAGEIVENLKKLNVEYKINPTSGAIQVPADQVHALRLQLAGMGLPKESNTGFEIMEKDTGFGVSQLVEGARYQRAQEGEIARSIMTIRAVKSARVHLAMPKESVFVRQPRKPSASVVVELKPGESLDARQVEAIVRLVSTSVSQLEPGQISVVDQRGHLLYSQERQEQNREFEATTRQFDYKREVEQHLIERVENILTPVAGKDGMRTQVTADVDFTVTERTQEVYNPDLPALRSEQTSEEQKRAAAVQGVPGALTNQPPPAGVAPELTGQPKQPGQPGQATVETPDVNTSKSSTRNFELDKTISHTRLSTGGVRRLTVAVVLDHQRVLRADGSLASQPFSDEDLTRFNELVKQAVGYDAARGDRVTVTNAAFRPEETEPGLQMWEQPWFYPLLKQLLTALVLLLLVFGVLRPLVRGLTGQAEAEAREKAEREAREAAQTQTAAGEGGVVREGELAPREREKGVPALEHGEEEEMLMLLEAPQGHAKRLAFVQRAIDEDPKRVALVIKNWINVEG